MGSKITKICNQKWWKWWIFQISITLRLLGRFLKFWVFWASLIVYFLILVLFCDNSRLPCDNARRSGIMTDRVEEYYVTGFGENHDFKASIHHILSIIILSSIRSLVKLWIFWEVIMIMHFLVLVCFAIRVNCCVIALTTRPVLEGGSKAFLYSDHFLISESQS